jgi:hypothetical protein
MSEMSTLLRRMKMSIRKIVVTTSILTVFAIALFIYPSIDQSISAEQSKFSGHEEHQIALPEATGLTKAFRLTTTSDAVLAQYFGKDALEKTLAQYGCVGLRMYYGKHKDGSPTIVIVGVDNKGEDMTSGLICQRARPCPPLCPTESELKRTNSFATLNH